MFLLISTVVLAGPEDFSKRVETAIESTREMKIELTDMLGEGEGAWDDDPRYPTGSLNCMIWLQWVLALAYMPESPGPALDAIRYYNSQPAFATRKHFIDRWLALEPGPLSPVTEQLSGAKSKTVTLELNRLVESRKYSCDLAAPMSTTITFSYLSSVEFLEAVPELGNGWYVVFPVANTAYYTDLYPASGPMGQVHSMLLDTRGSEPRIWHASIDYGSVVSEHPKAFAHRMRELIDGFTVYSLDPGWVPVKRSEATLPSTANSLRCESDLVIRKTE